MYSKLINSLQTENQIESEKERYERLPLEELVYINRYEEVYLWK
jgi:hypothetical protein